MEPAERATYLPVNTLKPVADNVWIVDGPVIRFGPSWPKFPFPTRMTVIRVGAGDLFIHSPTPLMDELRQEIESIGAPRWIVGPNRIHYWWIRDWRNGFPGAQVYLAPRIREQAGPRIDFDAFLLDRDCGYPWDRQIATLLVSGSYMTEAEFFHRPSRTLVLTDLIENFEPQKLDSALLRWLTRLGGVQHPDGRTPADLRLTFTASELRAAVEKMTAWNPERIIIAHGRWYERDGAAELRRAFRSVLGS